MCFISCDISRMFAGRESSHDKSGVSGHVLYNKAINDILTMRT